MRTTSRRRSRSLQFEQLEPRRVMAAGVTATFTGGVLKVTGTDGADNIQFIQGNGLIGVVGIYNAWSASQVKSISVELKGGDDRVSLDSVAYGWEPLAEDFTINSGTGAEIVRLADGRDVALNGPGHTLKVSASGAATLDGAAVPFPSGPASTLTVTLGGNVLRVTGTAGADNIQFIQGNGLIGVVGIYNAWSAAQVNSIVVDLYGGDDRVSLDSVGYGWQPMAEDFTINSGAGTETVRLADGHDVALNGTGHTLKVAASGAATLDGAALTFPPAPAAVLTATQAGSVLRVTGTAGADNIQFIQGNGLIGVVGIYNAWTASTITSIVVDLFGGDDRVSLDSVGYGWQPMAEDFTINSGAGTETVRLASGVDVTLNGSGHTLQVAANGAAQLDGVALPPTVVTATQIGGVLRVAGTAGADNIQFIQGNGLIGVVGIYNAWSAALVTSIVVDLNGGDDTVSLDSVAYGWQAMPEDFTLNSGAGTQTVRLAGGFQVVLNGPGHTLQVAANGTANLDGATVYSPQPTNWFDANVIDAALRSLGSSRYADGSISRNDMIDLFRNAEDGGAVDATELSDLRAMVANSTLFASLDYVWKLANYVVSANPANAFFQGQALGNLAAGSTTAQLEKLISKWFLGADHPVTTGTYRQFSGQLFVNGPTYGDVKQGNLGDCYFMCSLAEAALRSPATINSMFIVNGDGTYTVRFFNGGVSQYVTVDSYLPTNANGR